MNQEPAEGSILVLSPVSYFQGEAGLTELCLANVAYIISDRSHGAVQ